MKLAVPGSPGAVHRAVQQVDAARRQLGAERVNVVDVDGELCARTGLRRGHLGRVDQLAGCGGLEQVDERPAELVDRRVLITEVEGQAERPLVELLGGIEVLDEQRDRADSIGPAVHEHSSNFARRTARLHLTLGGPSDRQRVRHHHVAAAPCLTSGRLLA
jgi:hypothetical protein